MRPHSFGAHARNFDTPLRPLPNAADRNRHCPDHRRRARRVAFSFRTSLYESSASAKLLASRASLPLSSKSSTRSARARGRVGRLVPSSGLGRPAVGLAPSSSQGSSAGRYRRRRRRLRRRPVQTRPATERLKQRAAKTKSAARRIALVLIITLPNACLDCDIETNLGVKRLRKKELMDH